MRQPATSWFHMAGGKRRQASLVVALLSREPMYPAVGMFLDPFMCRPVRQGHFVELASSMLVFGGIAGWVMAGQEG